jgi:glyceraldehyde-3-phosphate dehydrogenase (NADP+)
MREFGRFIDGRFEDEGERLEVRDPQDGSVCGTVRASGSPELERALLCAARTFPSFAAATVASRADVLIRAAEVIEARREEFAETIRAEAGKPLLLARGEVARASATLRITAGAVREMAGEFRRMDGWDQGAGLAAITRRVPIGPVVAISPFNFPLNLALHKVAPALAAGCPVVLKPARKTPLAACLLAEALIEAGLPAGALQVLVAPPSVAEGLVTDPRPRLLTFTGSAEVGWRLKSLAGRKRTVLELGGNAPAIVEPDADLAAAARNIAIGAFAYAGQVCISVQRVLVHESIEERFSDLLLAAIREHVRVGATTDPAVLAGPMISAAEADRVEGWIVEALAAGARSLTGPLRREGPVIHPVLLADVPHDARVWREEAFGPVAAIAPYRTFEEGVALANDSEFGLQAGVFTRDVRKAMYAFDHLEVGGVVLGDAPTRRVDHMPYGGVKGSGEGREGPRSALEHMTEERLLLITG